MAGKFGKFENSDRRLAEEIGNGLLQFGISFCSVRRVALPTDGDSDTIFSNWKLPDVSTLGGSGLRIRTGFEPVSSGSGHDIRKIPVRYGKWRFAMK